MKKIIKVFVTLSVFVLVLSGCTTVPRYNYDQKSPMINVMKDSDFKNNSVRDEDPVRYDGYTTLGISLNQLDEVVISVVFDYRVQSNRRVSASNCELFIKSSDSPYFDKIKCRVRPTGSSFIISFDTTHKRKAFDLEALKCEFVGGRYWFYSNSIISVSYISNRTETLECRYSGPDHLNLL